MYDLACFDTVQLTQVDKLCPLHKDRKQQHAPRCKRDNRSYGQRTARRGGVTSWAASWDSAVLLLRSCPSSFRTVSFL